jgi:hypothetical protein
VFVYHLLYAIAVGATRLARPVWLKYVKNASELPSRVTSVKLVEIRDWS